MSDLELLKDFAELDNIAEYLNEEELNRIGDILLRGYEEDKISTEAWREKAKEALALTSLDREQKNYPMPNSSNVKYPLITTAAIQFTARTLPELMRGGEVAKYRIVGKDPDGKKDRRGKRLTQHLNHQLLETMPNWMDEHDRLLMHLSVVGTVFSKTWYDPIEKMNRSEFIPYNEIIVNNSIKSLEDAPRINHLIYMTENELVEHERHGLFLPLGPEAIESDDSDTVNAQEMIEQHCWLDLDEDGLKEPYIVTFHKASHTVVRILARFDADGITFDPRTEEIQRIKAKTFFSDYHFIHDPSGGFYSFGFGTLLHDLNSTVNTTLNQLLDAGRLANLQGGFIGAGMRMRSKTIDIEPGEWLMMESANGESIRNNIVPLQYKEPSMVLFQLLGMLIDAAEGLTSTTEALTGTAESQNTSPNTIMALIQQGLKVFLSIQRRVFRGYKKEFLKIVELNRVFLDQNEYVDIIDPSIQELEEMIDQETGEIMDYKLSGNDIVPVADVNAATEAERLGKMQAELQGGIQLAQIGGVEPRALAFNYFTNLESENLESLVAPPPPQQQGPDPALIELQSKLDKTAKELELKERELNIKMAETEAKIKKMFTESIKNVADAEAAEIGSQVAQYTAVVNAQQASISNDTTSKGQGDTNGQETNASSSTTGLDGTPPNGGSV